jgi:hypothetical protein
MLQQRHARSDILLCTPDLLRGARSLPLVSTTHGAVVADLHMVDGPPGSGRRFQAIGHLGGSDLGKNCRVCPDPTGDSVLRFDNQRRSVRPK